MSEPRFPIAAMLTGTDILTIERTLQLAIAPAFVLGSIMAVLSLLSGRLQRIADLEADIEKRAAATPQERRVVFRRARLLYYAMAATLLAAVLLCSLVIVSFIEPLAGVTVGVHVAGLLIAGMASLTAALVLFFCELMISARSLPFGRF